MKARSEAAMDTEVWARTHAAVEEAKLQMRLDAAVEAAKLEMNADAVKQRQDYLWTLVQELERAAWERKWSRVRKARRALEQVLGKRPHDPLFKIETGQHLLEDTLNKKG